MEDHENTLWLAQELKKVPEIDIETDKIQTNMLRFKFKKSYKKFGHD